jgi:hypothetical protein
MNHFDILNYNSDPPDPHASFDVTQIYWQQSNQTLLTPPPAYNNICFTWEQVYAYLNNLLVTAPFYKGSAITIWLVPTNFIAVPIDNTGIFTFRIPEAT